MARKKRKPLELSDLPAHKPTEAVDMMLKEGINRFHDNKKYYLTYQQIRMLYDRYQLHRLSTGRPRGSTDRRFVRFIGVIMGHMIAGRTNDIEALLAGMLSDEQGRPIGNWVKINMPRYTELHRDEKGYKFKPMSEYKKDKEEVNDDDEDKEPDEWDNFEPTKDWD